MVYSDDDDPLGLRGGGGGGKEKSGDDNDELLLSSISLDDDNNNGNEEASLTWENNMSKNASGLISAASSTSSASASSYSFLRADAETSDAWTSFRALARSGKLESPLRGAYWLLCARTALKPDGALTMTTGSWVDAVGAHRRAYEAQKSEAYEHGADHEADDLVKNNPLADGEDSSWAVYHKDMELLDEIEKDLNRLYPNGCGDMFCEASMRSMLKDMLFVWCKAHPETSYRQGMHELIAPIVYVLHTEAEMLSDTASAARHGILGSIITPEHVEHLSFSIFEAVMAQMEPMFAVDRRPKFRRRKVKAKSKTSVLDEIQEKENDLFGEKKQKDQAVENEAPKTPVLQLCMRIQNELLKKAAPSLYKHLMDLQIEPQFYALRWIRLMFGREFHIEDVLLLWDDMFSTAFEPGAVEDDRLPSRLAHIAVAMLMYIKKYLLECDYTRALQRLMRYPPCEDVRTFLVKGSSLRKARMSGDFSAFSADSRSASPVGLEDGANKPKPAARARVAFADDASNDDEGDLFGRDKVTPSPFSRMDNIGSSSSKMRSHDSTASSTSSSKSARQLKKNSSLGQMLWKFGKEVGATVAGGGSIGAKKRNLGEDVDADVLQLRMGGRLEKIIAKLEDNPEHYVHSTEALEVITAELKHVKDVLLGRINMDDDLNMMMSTPPPPPPKPLPKTQTPQGAGPLDV